MQTQYSNYNRLYLSASKLEHMTLVGKSLRLSKAQEKEKPRMRQIVCNYRTNEKLVSPLGSAFIAINFLNVKRSFIIGK